MAGMDGMSASNGAALGGIDHLRQSIKDILTTPVGSRVMRRDYGSRLYQLVDAPMNRQTLMNIYAATAEALARTDARTGLPVEPRFRLLKVTASNAAPGAVTLDLQGEYLPDGRVVSLDGVTV